MAVLATASAAAGLTMITIALFMTGMYLAARRDACTRYWAIAAVLMAAFNFGFGAEIAARIADVPALARYAGWDVQLQEPGSTFVTPFGVIVPPLLVVAVTVKTSIANDASNVCDAVTFVKV